MRRSLALRAGFALCLLLVAATARAHDPSRMNSREIVRMAGWFGDPPKGVAVVRDVPLTVQGKQRQFHATEWQVFGLVMEQNEKMKPIPDSVILQGPREALARLSAARPEQRVAILAERRPDGGELFILALDLCPEK